MDAKVITVYNNGKLMKAILYPNGKIKFLDKV